MEHWSETVDIEELVLKETLCLYRNICNRSVKYGSFDGCHGCVFLDVPLMRYKHVHIKENILSTLYIEREARCLADRSDF